VYFCFGDYIFFTLVEKTAPENLIFFLYFVKKAKNCRKRLNPVACTRIQLDWMSLLYTRDILFSVEPNIRKQGGGERKKRRKRKRKFINRERGKDQWVRNEKKKFCFLFFCTIIIIISNFLSDSTCSYTNVLKGKYCISNFRREICCLHTSTANVKSGRWKEKCTQPHPSCCILVQYITGGILPRLFFLLNLFWIRMDSQGLFSNLQTHGFLLQKEDAKLALSKDSKQGSPRDNFISRVECRISTDKITYTCSVLSC